MSIDERWPEAIIRHDLEASKFSVTTIDGFRYKATCFDGKIVTHSDHYEIEFNEIESICGLAVEEFLSNL
jgi:hypothetical protein